MAHVLATASLHDGGGIFTLAWSLVVIPVSLAMIFNYRGVAERWAERVAEQPTRRMLGRMGRGGRTPVSPQAVRIGAGLFLAFGIIALGLAISRFAEGGY